MNREERRTPKLGAPQAERADCPNCERVVSVVLVAGRRSYNFHTTESFGTRVCEASHAALLDAAGVR